MSNECVNPQQVGTCERLAGKLEAVTEQALDKLSALMSEPVDVENGSLLRAQVTACAVAINAQLRADSMRLRALRQDTALAALLALIASKEKGIPCDVELGQSAALAHAASV